MKRTTVSLCLAATGLVLALLLGSIQSTIWHGPQAPPQASALALVLAPELAGAPAAASLAQPPAAYFFYGHGCIAIYLCLALGWLLSPLARASALPRHVLHASWVLAFMADVAAYWLSESYGPGLRAIAFWRVELPLLALAGVALTWLGLLRWRREPGARWWTLALPLALLASAWLRYLPHGLLLGYASVLTSQLLLAPKVEPKRRGAGAVAVDRTVGEQR